MLSKLCKSRIIPVLAWGLLALSCARPAPPLPQLLSSTEVGHSSKKLLSKDQSPIEIRLKALEALKEEKVINEKEYQAARNKIIAEL